MDYVLLSHQDKKLDTIALNTSGAFDFQCENLQTNLYIIKHGELQYIFIEPGDSIMFRLNTVGFDESLAFSGRG
ncbi:MAG: transaldolase, partial [Patiriisocius sp.]